MQNIYQCGYYVHVLLPLFYNIIYYFFMSKAYATVKENDGKFTDVVNFKEKDLVRIYDACLVVELTLLIIESGLLYNAIYRIRSTMSGKKGLQANERVMCIHVSAFAVVNVGLLLYMTI